MDVLQPTRVLWLEGLSEIEFRLAGGGSEGIQTAGMVGIVRQGVELLGDKGVVVEAIDVTATFMCRCVAVDNQRRRVMRTVDLLICWLTSLFKVASSHDNVLTQVVCVKAICIVHACLVPSYDLIGRWLLSGGNENHTLDVLKEHMLKGHVHQGSMLPNCYRQKFDMDISVSEVFFDLVL